jgi:hypothetical protein
MTSINDYRKKHCCCPKCGSQNYETTTVGFYLKDTNKVVCYCGWKGIGNELVSEKENIKENN